MNTELLESLCLATAVSGDEHDVRQLLLSRLEGISDEIVFDGLGSVIARKGSRGPKIAIVGHMDEVGFIVKHISADGFIRFDTIGSWWNQSMLNHQVAIRTRSGVSIPGLMGSIAPHALSSNPSNTARCLLILAQPALPRSQQGALRWVILLAHSQISPVGAMIALWLKRWITAWVAR